MDNTNNLDPKQLEALNMALNSDVKQFIINGQAGTGKTHTVQEIAKRLEAMGHKVSRVAPTGRAALKVGGTTIHVWLEPEVETYPNGNCRIIGFNKYFFERKEILIVDESSMIDDELFEEIMSVYHASPKARIIWVGDEGQLEPVGMGTPYIDMINNKSIPMVTLDTIHRTADGNDIVLYADAIRNDKPEADNYKNIGLTNKDIAVEQVVKDPHSNQILCPMKNSMGGTKWFNKLIQPQMDLGGELLVTIEWNNFMKQYKPTGIKIHVGDKVVFTKNNVALEVTNGTVAVAKGLGEMVFFGRKTKALLVETNDGSELKIPTEWASKNTDLAYAITIHKGQGSEWDNVYVSAYPTQTKYFNKKMHYTAVTRGKKQVGLMTT